MRHTSSDDVTAAKRKEEATKGRNTTHAEIFFKPVKRPDIRKLVRNDEMMKNTHF